MSETDQTANEIGLDQIGVVTHDLQGMVQMFKQLFGIGPFRVMEWPIEGVDPQATYHGAPGNYRLLLAFGSVGPTQIEIVQPLEGLNIYSDFLKSHGPGLHQQPALRKLPAGPVFIADQNGRISIQQNNWMASLSNYEGAWKGRAEKGNG